MRLAPQEIRTYFTTFSTAGRRRIFQTEVNAGSWWQLCRHIAIRQIQPHAFVVMPDHVHVQLTPAVEVSLEKAIQYIKGSFSFRLKSKLDVWKRGHFDKRVPDRATFDACVTYIECNPVVAGIVAEPGPFKFSSASGRFELDPVPDWFA